MYGATDIPDWCYTETGSEVAYAQPTAAQVLSLLALLVQKYKSTDTWGAACSTRRRSTCRQWRTFLKLLHQCCCWWGGMIGACHRFNRRSFTTRSKKGMPAWRCCGMTNIRTGWPKHRKGRGTVSSTFATFSTGISELEFAAPCVTVAGVEGAVDNFRGNVMYFVFRCKWRVQAYDKDAKMIPPTLNRLSFR